MAELKYNRKENVMANEREKVTLLQRLGFDDADLTMPEHDEIMAWLDRQLHEYPVQMLNEIVDGYSKDIWLDRCNKLLEGWKRLEGPSEEDTKRMLETVPPWNSPDRGAVTVDSIEKEFPVMAVNSRNPERRSRAVVGYIDMYADVGKQIPMLWRNGDLKVEWAYDVTHFRLAIEVTTSIPSLRELICQINIYRQQRIANYYVVVSPDDRFIEPLKQQDIHFIRYQFDKTTSRLCHKLRRSHVSTDPEKAAVRSIKEGRGGAQMNPEKKVRR